MSRKAPLSIDEKKARMLQLFYEKKEVFQMKELEKIAPKEKGITMNSVKEVVQALVDDAVVDTDKIGGSIYFWAFPSKNINQKKRKLKELQNIYETSNKRLKTVTKTVTEAKVGKENVEDTKKIMAEIEKLRQKRDKVMAELKSNQENNPETLLGMKQETSLIKDAANRWTDNIFAVKSWCKKKFFMEEKTLNKQFGVPEDLDYLE